MELYVYIYIHIISYNDTYIIIYTHTYGSHGTDEYDPIIGPTGFKFTQRTSAVLFVVERRFFAGGCGLKTPPGAWPSSLPSR